MREPTDGKRVLVVDDDQALLRMIEHWLTASGYAVEICSSFEAAKHQLMRSPPPDVLLTDIRLGVFNGLHLVMLAKDLSPRTAAIVMSAYDDVTMRKEASLYGAAYLPKPFTGEAMFNSLSCATHGEPQAT
jgi:DNA-binding NtrC family response regulator